MADRLSTQLLDSTMKQGVYPEIVDQFQQKRQLYNWLPKGEKNTVNSLGTKIPGYFIPPAGNGFIAEGSRGPRPTAAEDAAYQVRYTRFRHAIEYTYDALRHMQNASEFGLARGLNKDMARHTTAAMKQLNQLSYGNGNGNAGTLSAAGNGASATITFFKTAASGWTLGSKNIQKNGYYDLVDITNNTILDTAVKITAVDYTAGTAVGDSVDAGVQTAISGGATVIAVKTGSWNKAHRGLEYHIRNGSFMYQTLSSSDYNDIRSTVVSGGDNPITVAIFERLEQEMKYRVEDEDGEIIYLSSPAQIEAYKLLGYSAKRWEGDAKTFDGSFKDVKFGDRMWKEDVDCPKDTIYRLAKKLLQTFEFRPWGPIDEGEGMWKSPPSYDSDGIGGHFERVRGNLGIDFEIGGIKPSGLGKINRLDFTDVATGEY